jgi:hypothetical protein
VTLEADAVQAAKEAMANIPSGVRIPDTGCSRDVRSPNVTHLVGKPFTETWKIWFVGVKAVREKTGPALSRLRPP